MRRFVVAVIAAVSALGFALGAAAQQRATSAKPVPPSQTAEELLKGIKVPQGFKATIFAAPPQVSYPTCIDAAPTGGEVFIGIDQTGSLGKQADGGWVVRCTVDPGDTGKATAIKVFARMDHPRGLIWDQANHQLFVLHPPYLTVYHDDAASGGGGGLARGEDLLVGISNEETVQQRGADHTTNGITLGIDGWIYIAVGDFGFLQCKGADGKVYKNHGGGVARVRPDGTELEMVSINQRNIYGVGVDPLLNIFTRDNTNDGDGWDERFHHIVPLCNIGYPMLFKHFSEDLLPRLADYGGGAPCGTVYVDEPGLPKPFGRMLYTCDWGRSMVYRHPLAADGATFSVQQEPFVTIPRPTDMRVDGQGRMYITSWRGGQFSYDGPNIGFVARVTTDPAPKRAPYPNLARLADAQVVQHLLDDSAIMRLYASREILRRGPKPALVDVLPQLALSSGAPLGAKVAAIFTLKQLAGSSATPALVKLCGDATMREFALKALADRKTQLEGVPAEPFLKALGDDNPRVRVQALIGLARMERKDAADSILALTSDRDRVVAHIATRALITMHADDACIAALDHIGSPTYEGAVNVLKWFHEPKVVDALIAHLASAEGNAAARKPLLMALCRLYYDEAEWDGRWWGTRPTSSGPYYKWVAWGESEKIGKVLQNTLRSADPEMTRFLLTELGRNHLDTPDVVKQMVALAQKDAAFKASVIEMLAASTTPTPAALGLLEDVAKADKDEALRGKALRGLTNAQNKEALEYAVRALVAVGPDAPGELRNAREAFVRDGRRGQDVEFFTKLAASNDPATRELAYSVLAVVGSGGRSIRGSREAAGAVVDKAWAEPAAAVSLLRAIGQTKLDNYGDKVRVHLKDPNADVQKAAVYAADLLKLSSASGTAKMLADIPYEQVLADVPNLKGRAVIGQQLFLRQGCVACHTVNAEDPPKGPFLGDIAVRAQQPEIIESILKPSAKIAQGFQSFWFEMKDKDRKEGFIVREGADEVEIRDITGASTTIKLKDVAKRGKLETSIMPEGIAGNMTLQEFTDLVAYLGSLKGK
jgi:putative heme-binding domain-containing protein